MRRGAARCATSTRALVHATSTGPASQPSVGSGPEPHRPPRPSAARAATTRLTSARCARPSAAHKCHGSSSALLPHDVDTSTLTRRSGSDSPRAARSVKLPEVLTRCAQRGAEEPCSSTSSRSSKGPAVASRTGGLSARSPAQRNGEQGAWALRVPSMCGLRASSTLAPGKLRLGSMSGSGWLPRFEDLRWFEF